MSASAEDLRQLPTLLESMAGADGCAGRKGRVRLLAGHQHALRLAAKLTGMLFTQFVIVNCIFCFHAPGDASACSGRSYCFLPFGTIGTYAHMNRLSVAVAAAGRSSEQRLATALREERVTSCLLAPALEALLAGRSLITTQSA